MFSQAGSEKVPIAFLSNVNTQEGFHGAYHRSTGSQG